jgi:hypothetical protein
VSEGAGRAMKITSMQELYDKKILESGGYRFMLRADISRFFPTIYTHSVPWAVHGKFVAKKNMRKITPAFYGNVIDKYLRAGQDGQTIGIPIGPDTSHIVAEALATSVDVLFKEKFGRWPAGFRYVDDYYLFFEEQGEAERALADLSRALQEYELQLNFDKTRVVPVNQIADDYWTQQIRNLDVSNETGKQRSDINHYFDFTLDLARHHEDDSIMNYALRRISSVLVRKENWDLFESHLCRIVFAHPNTLQLVASFLSTYGRYGYLLDKERLSRMSSLVIRNAAPLNHHSEVAWALWICLDLKLKLDKKAVGSLVGVRSSVCLLLALDMERKGLTSKRISKSILKSFMTAEALRSDMWLFAYEAGIRKWIVSDDSHIAGDPHFKELYKREIHFYSDSATLSPIFMLKPGILADLNLENESALFDSDEDVTEYLEFDEPNSEYQDKDESEDIDDLL